MAAREQWYHPYLNQPGARVSFLKQASLQRGSTLPTYGGGTASISWDSNDEMKRKRLVKIKIGKEEATVDVATLSLILDTV